jgi:hypothetical protein
MKHPWIFSMTLTVAFISGNALAAKPGAHVHGEAMMQIVQDGGTVTINLESPLDNFLGFEYAPRTDKQRQRAKAMEETLRQPETLFVLTPEAQCKAGPVQLTAPVLGLGGAAQGNHGKKKEDEEHAGLEAEMVYTCSKPAALKDIEVTLFDAFRGIRRIDVQVVGPRGQSATRLTCKKRRLAW